MITIKLNLPILLITVGLLFNCEEKEEDSIQEPDVDNVECSTEESLEIPSKSFNMGFSTWSYGPDVSDRDDTYDFISDNADIYSEQIDNKIPWNAWINNTDLPDEFVLDIESRVTDRIVNHDLILSVSLLNTGRTDLLEDYDGSIPSYDKLSDQTIEDAYFSHLDYLVEKMNPNYLIVAMEINELYIHSNSRWEEYKELMGNIRFRIKEQYPNLPISESITLHNWHQDSDPDFINEISTYVNQNTDFAAVSFYPFFLGQHTKSDFQRSFDFLHDQIDKPIGFVETTHLAEDLIVASLNINISSDVCEQKDYLESLLQNAQNEDYEFVIWWAYRDYDELWETFPDNVKDVGQIWRDTGLLDEDGLERPALTIWENILGT